MADGYIQVPADSVGKKVDVEELIRGDGVTVERQRVKIPDPVNIDGDVAQLMVSEFQIMNFLLTEILGAMRPSENYNLNQIRAEIALNKEIFYAT